MAGVNKVIHSNPELVNEEYIAHDTLSSYLEKQSYTVTRKAHGLDTSFQAEFGTPGRIVVFCAEYDALPGIGHACGHNLVATSSLAAFLGAARVLLDLGLAGRVRILGTPAEEGGGGGKVKLIEAGALDPPPGEPPIAGAFMVHPMSSESLGLGSYAGLAGWRLIASEKLRVEQQIQPDERIHGVFEDGGAAPNVVPEYTRMNWCEKSSTVKRSKLLLGRVKRCFEAGALAAGCEVKYIPSLSFMDLRVNNTLSETFVEEMAILNESFLPREVQPKAFGSTDMGNVSYTVPSFHGRGLAMLAVRVLVEEGVAEGARRDFEKEEDDV
ncbi:hypothetical protein BJX62DRAFT_221891 [Aspergillus germanicus]